MSFDEWFLERARVSSKRHTRITMDDKMLFFQQLASLVSSGTPLFQSLELCGQQSLSTKLESRIRDIASHVAAGMTLESAMAQHLDVFEAHWVALIGTGEMSGKMGQILCDLNEQIRQARETMRKITGALIYPMILLFVSVIVIAVMLGFVVPTFADMFAEMNAELPGITLFVVDVSNCVVDYGIFGILAVLGIAAGLRKYLKTDEGRRRVGAVGMSIPLVGDLMVQAAMYRFSANLALLLKSGVPMLETLTAMATVFRTNPVYRDAIQQAQRRVAAGRPLADSLQSSQLFTSMMTHMVHVGEESAQLANIMDQLAPYYREKMNGFVGKVTKMLEPSIIMFMGLAIAVVMLAIYIPMFEMSGKIN